MKRITNGVMTEEDTASLFSAREQKKFFSKLKVFSSTMGIRPNEFSVIVGPSGNGKSTLCKTISVECAIGGKKCYHLLSEEKSSIYKGIISNTFTKMADGKNVNTFLEKLYFESMLDWDAKEANVNYFFEHLKNVINELNPDMIIFDNFTTSFLAELPIGIQGNVIGKLRRMASDYEVSIIGVFHTAKGTDLYKKILDGEDVRGNASTTNAGSYNYILSTYFRVSPIRAIINVDKARYHPEVNKTYYEMYYDKDLGIYVKDMKINFEDVKQIIDDYSKKKPAKKEGLQW